MVCIWTKHSICWIGDRCFSRTYYCVEEGGGGRYAWMKKVCNTLQNHGFLRDYALNFIISEFKWEKKYQLANFLYGNFKEISILKVETLDNIVFSVFAVRYFFLLTWPSWPILAVHIRKVCFALLLLCFNTIISNILDLPTHSVLCVTQFSAKCQVLTTLCPLHTISKGYVRLLL